jgi:hypothetical protein
MDLTWNSDEENKCILNLWKQGRWENNIKMHPGETGSENVN